VTALADDLRRFLHHEPISARPASLGYHVVTFVRRHTVGVATSIAVVLVIAGLTAVNTRRLAAERDRAQRETAKAVKVSEMLMGVLTSADPYAIRGQSGEPTVRALLDAGVTQVQNELTEQPELQVQLLTSMGRTYRRLAEYATAERLLEQALAIGERVFGPQDVRIGHTLDYLGVVLADRGDYAGAGRQLERALEIRRKQLGPEHEDVAVTLAELGRVYQDEGRNQQAEPLHREALAIRRKVLGNEHRETAVSLSDLASVLRLNGNLDDAETLLKQCLELNRKTRGEDHPNTSTTLHDLALIAAARGEYHSAETLFRRVLATERATLGDRHPVVATSLNSLSHVLIAERRLDDAASSLEEALSIARVSLGNDHQLVGIYSINLASVQVDRRKPAEAEPLLREGLRIRTQAPQIVPGRRRTFADDDWSIGATKSLLGAALVLLGRYNEAETVLLDARNDLASHGRPQPGAMKTTLNRLVQLYVAWGKRDRAESYRALLGS
jgi:tetratricopeptide (TPR) repeat protein